MNLEVEIKQLQQNVFKKFNEYKWEKPILKNECVPTTKKGSKITLNNTQKFVSKFVNPGNPNGILLWHSVGSGKTLSAVAILKSFEEKNYNTLWITRTTLKGDLQKALDILPLKKKLTVLSYKQFSNIGKSKGELYKSLIRKAKKIKSDTDDPLYKTIIVIDEVHKLYTKDLKPQEMHSISSIQNMIHKSYDTSMNNSCKIVLMSATPMTSDPMEIINLFNLIIEFPVNRFNINNFKSDYLDDNGKFTKEGLETFQDRIKDLVSYIDMSKDPRKFAQVQMNEILVPISSPEYLDINTDACENSYRECIKNNTESYCKTSLINCLKQFQKLKISEKTQSKIFKKRCNIDIL